MIARETSCTGNNRRVRARSCPGNVFPGKVMSGKVIVRETSCPGIVLSGNRVVRERSCPGNVLSGKCLVRETSVRESDCPGNVRYPVTVTCGISMLWDNTAYCVQLSGEDVTRYSNKIESVRKRPCRHYLTEKVMSQ